MSALPECFWAIDMSPWEHFSFPFSVILKPVSEALMEAILMNVGGDGMNVRGVKEKWTIRIELGVEQLPVLP